MQNGQPEYTGPPIIEITLHGRPDGHMNIQTTFFGIEGGWASVANILNIAYKSAVRQSIEAEMAAEQEQEASRIQVPGLNFSPDMFRNRGKN